MVGAEEKQASQVQPEEDYTPGKVAHYLSIWPELLEEADPGVRSTSRFSWEPDGSGVIDAAHAIVIMVDLERAWLKLHHWSLEYQMVEWSMKRPLQIEHKDYMVMVAKSLRVSLGMADDAFSGACRKMAENLGWGEAR